MNVIENIQQTNRKKKSNKRVQSLLISKAKTLWSPVKYNTKDLQSILNTYNYRQMQQMARNMGLEPNLSKRSLAKTILLNKNVFFPEEVGKYTHGMLIHMIRDLKVVSKISDVQADILTKSQAQGLLMDAWNGGSNNDVLLKMQQVIELHDVMQGLEDKFCSSKVKKKFRQADFYTHVEQLMTSVLQLYEQWMKAKSLLQRRSINARAEKVLKEAFRAVQLYIDTIRKECKSKIYYQCDASNMPDLVSKWMKVSDVDNKLVMCNVTVKGKVVEFQEGDMLVPGMKIYVAVKSVNEDGEPVIWLGVGSDSPSIQFVYDKDINDTKQEPLPDEKQEQPEEESDDDDLHDIPNAYARPVFQPVASNVNLDIPVTSNIPVDTPVFAPETVTDNELEEKDTVNQNESESVSDTGKSEFVTEAASLIKDAVLMGGKFAVSKTLEALFFSVFANNFSADSTDLVTVNNNSNSNNTANDNTNNYSYHNNVHEIPVAAISPVTPAPKPTLSSVATAATPNNLPSALASGSQSNISTTASAVVTSRAKKQIQQEKKVLRQLEKKTVRPTSEERTLSSFQRRQQEARLVQRTYKKKKVEENIYRLRRKLQMSKMSEKEQIRRLQGLLQKSKATIEDANAKDVQALEKNLEEAEDLLELRGRKRYADQDEDDETDLINEAEDQEEQLLKKRQYGKASPAAQLIALERDIQNRNIVSERQAIRNQRAQLLIKVNKVLEQKEPSSQAVATARKDLIASRNLRWQQDANLLRQLSNLMQSEYELKYVDNSNSLTPAPAGIPTYVIRFDNINNIDNNNNIYTITVQRDYNKPPGWLLQSKLLNTNNQYNQPLHHFVQNTPQPVNVGASQGLSEQTYKQYALVPFVHVNSWLSPVITSDTQAGKPVTPFLIPSPKLVVFTDLLSKSKTSWPQIPTTDVMVDDSVKNLVSQITYLNTMSDYMRSTSVDNYTPYYFNMGPMIRNVRQLEYFVQNRLPSPWQEFVHDTSVWIRDTVDTVNTYEAGPLIPYARGNRYASPENLFAQDKSNLQVPDIAVIPAPTLNVLWNHFFLTLQELGKNNRPLQRTASQLQDTLSYTLRFSNGLSLSIEKNVFVSDALINVRMLCLHLMNMYRNPSVPDHTKSQVGNMLGELFVRMVTFSQSNAYKDTVVDTVQVVMDTPTHQDIVKSYTPVINEMKWLSEHLRQESQRLKNALALVVTQHDNMNHQVQTQPQHQQQPVKPTYIIDPRSLSNQLKRYRQQSTPQQPNQQQQQNRLINIQIDKVLQVTQPLGKEIAQQFGLRDQLPNEIDIISVFVSPLDFVWDMSRVPDVGVGRSFSNIYQISYDQNDNLLKYALNQFYEYGRMIQESQAITSVQGMAKPLRDYQDRQLVQWDPIVIPSFHSAVGILQQYPSYEGFLVTYANTITFLQSWIESHTHLYAPYTNYVGRNVVETIHVPTVEVQAPFETVYGPLIQLQNDQGQQLSDLNHQLRYFVSWHVATSQASMKAWLWFLDNFFQQLPTSGVTTFVQNNNNSPQRFLMPNWEDLSYTVDQFFGQVRADDSKAVTQYLDLGQEYFQQLSSVLDTTTITVEINSRPTMFVKTKPSNMIRFFKSLPPMKKQSYRRLPYQLQVQVNHLYQFSNDLQPVTADESEPDLPLAVPDLGQLRQDFQNLKVVVARPLQNFLSTWQQAQQQQQQQTALSSSNSNRVFTNLMKRLPVVPTLSVAPVNVKTSNVVAKLSDFNIDVGSVYHGVRDTTHQVQDWSNYVPPMTTQYPTTMIQPLTIDSFANTNGFGQSLPFSNQLSYVIIEPNHNNNNNNNNNNNALVEVQVNSVVDIQPRARVLNKLIKLDPDRRVNALIRPVGAQSITRFTSVNDFTFADKTMTGLMQHVYRNLAMEQKVKLLNTRETIAAYAKTASESLLSTRSSDLTYWNLFEQTQNFNLVVKLMYYTSILEQYTWVYDSNLGTWKLTLFLNFQDTPQQVANVETIFTDQPVVDFTLPANNALTDSTTGTVPTIDVGTGADIYTALTQDNYYPQNQPFTVISYTSDGHTVMDSVLPGRHQIPVSFFSLWNGVQQQYQQQRQRDSNFNYFRQVQSRAVIHTVNQALNLIRHDSSSFVNQDVVQTIMNDVSSCSLQVGVQAPDLTNLLFDSLHGVTQVSRNQVQNTVLQVYGQGGNRDVVAHELFQIPFSLHPSSSLFTHLSEASNDNSLLDNFATVQSVPNGSELALMALRDFVLTNFAEAAEVFDGFYANVLQTNVNRDLAFVQLTRVLSNLLRVDDNRQHPVFFNDQAVSQSFASRYVSSLVVRVEDGDTIDISVERERQTSHYVYGDSVNTAMAESTARTLQILQSGFLQNNNINNMNNNLQSLLDVTIATYISHRGNDYGSNRFSTENVFEVMSSFLSTFLQTVTTPPLSNINNNNNNNNIQGIGQVRRWNEMTTTFSFIPASNNYNNNPLINNLFERGIINTNAVVQFWNVARHTMTQQQMPSQVAPIAHRAQQISNTLQNNNRLQNQVTLAGNDLSNVFKVIGCPALSYTSRTRLPLVPMMYDDDRPRLMQALLGETSLLLNNAQFRAELKEIARENIRESMREKIRKDILKKNLQLTGKINFLNHLATLQEQDNEDYFFGSKTVRKKISIFRRIASFLSPAIIRSTPLSMYLKGHVVAPELAKLQIHPAITYIVENAQNKFPLEYEFVKWLGQEYIAVTIANVLLPILPNSQFLLNNPVLFQQTPVAGVIRRMSLKQTFAMLGPHQNGVKEEEYSQLMTDANGNVFDYMAQEYRLDIDKHLMTSSHNKVMALTQFLQDLINSNNVQQSQIPDSQSLQQYTGSMYSANEVSNIYGNLQFPMGFGGGGAVSTMPSGLSQSVRLASATFHRNHVVSRAVSNMPDKRRVEIVLTGFHTNF